MVTTLSAPTLPSPTTPADAPASAALLSMRKKRPTYRVSLTDMRNNPIPEATKTWTPTPHHQIIDYVLEACQARNLTIAKQEFNLSRDKGQMFGILVMKAEIGSDFSLAMGLRNSIDKTMPVGIAAGAQVMVCDNNSFSGEVVIKRKHTNRIEFQLPGLIGGAVDQFLLQARHQQEQFATWKRQEISVVDATNLIVQAAEQDIVPVRAILPIRQEFLTPRHAEFEGGRIWTLYNSFTQYLTHDRGEMNPKRVQEDFLGMHRMVAAYSASMN